MTLDNTIEFDPVKHTITWVQLALGKMLVAEERYLTKLIIDTFPDSYNAIDMISFVTWLTFPTAAAKEHFSAGAFLTDSTNRFLVFLRKDLF